MFYSYVDSPIGPLLLSGNRDELRGLFFSKGSKAQGAHPDWARNDACFADAAMQLREYFDGQRKTFDLPLAPAGTPFQLSVLQALQEIPFGETCSYLDVAKRIGNPKAVRAVGAANGSNPIALIIPCHRVIGSNGSLTGFGGGLDSKKFLLQHEASHSGLFA